MDIAQHLYAFLIQPILCAVCEVELLKIFFLILSKLGIPCLCRVDVSCTRLLRFIQKVCRISLIYISSWDDVD
jgi:hypothetical protein